MRLRPQLQFAFTSVITDKRYFLARQEFVKVPRHKRIKDDQNASAVYGHFHQLLNWISEMGWVYIFPFHWLFLTFFTVTFMILLHQHGNEMHSSLCFRKHCVQNETGFT